jgi:uncharacterized LabA/DUF88 family protein
MSRLWRASIARARLWCSQHNCDRIAVFVDGDGISANHTAMVVHHLGRKRRISTIRVVGNITARNVGSWSEMIKREGVVMRHLPSLVVGKNAADVALAIDALELHLTRPFLSYAVLTNDADFTPLVLRLKEDGATVEGFGHKGTPINFRRACTRFTQISHIESVDASL